MSETNNAAPAGQGNTNPAQTVPEVKPDVTPTAPDSTKPEGAQATPAAPAAPEAKPDGKKDAPTGAPDKYDDFKLPEGVSADKDAMAKYAAVAKELNLTQEQAQRLVDFQAESVKAQTAAIKAQVESNRKALAEETKSMLGPQYEQKLASAAKAIDRFGTPELKAILDETGFGHHKELVSFFIKIGEAISEDRFVEGRQSGPAETAKVLFPSMK